MLSHYRFSSTLSQAIHSSRAAKPFGFGNEGDPFMSTLFNCKDCGKLFVQQNRVEHCSDCQAQNNRYFMQMREFLKFNPKSTVMEINAKTGIPISKILELRNSDYVPFRT